jgi:hypothetical protein
VTDTANNFDTALSDFSVQVRIERTITRARDADSEPPDEETTAEQDLYTPSKKSDWDGIHGSDV